MAGIMTTTRRLAAILAADVAGYSRLIGDDEEGTLDRLRVIRAEVVDPSIAVPCRQVELLVPHDGEQILNRAQSRSARFHRGDRRFRSPRR